MKITHYFQYLGAAMLVIALCSIGFIKPESSFVVEPPLLAISAVDEVVKGEMLHQNLIGVAVGVVQNGTTTHLKAYGYTDRLRTKPLTTNTILRWASISKTITAIAAFKAIEMDKLALSDKATKHVSYWPTTTGKKDITLAQLLSHRSGILHYGRNQDEDLVCAFNSGAYTANNNFNAQQCVNVFKNCPLASTPGTSHLYSTFGPNLAAAMIEAATQKSYVTFVKENIANIASMETLTAYSNDLADGYGTDCNLVIRPNPEGEVEWKLPGGGWASTIGDLTDFTKGMCNGIFLNNMAALWSPTISDNANYVYGVRKTSLAGKTHISHGGAHDNMRTYMGFFPDDKTGVCVMINHGDGVSADRVAKLVLKAIGYNTNDSDFPYDNCGTNESCGSKMVGIWHKTGNTEEVLLRRGYNSDEFHNEWETLGAQGYDPTDIETWMDGATRRWDGIFKKTNKKSALIRGYSQDGFHDKWVELSNQGLRLTDVETYVDGGTRKWAGVFTESSETYALFRNFTTDDFNAKYTELADRNMKLIDVEAYDAGGLRWAGVWKGTGASSIKLNRNYDEADFMTLNTQRESAGFKLIDAETYNVDGKRKWAGIWQQTTLQSSFKYNIQMCDWLNTYHTPYKSSGFELIDIDHY